MRDCDKFGKDEDRIGIGVGEPCPNEGIIHVFLNYVLCRECNKAYIKHRTTYGKKREDE